MVEDVYGDEFLDSLAPKGFGFRDNQRDIVRDILDAFQTHDYVCFTGGTGVGKSIIGLAVSNAFNDATILTASTDLQRQYMHDFPYLKEFKGKTHYDCKHNKKNISCEDCDIKTINKCKDCNYVVAKENFRKNGWNGLGNYHSFYFTNLRDGIYKDLLILDESHNCEDINVNFHTLVIKPELLTNTNIKLSHNGYELISMSKVNLSAIRAKLQSLVDKHARLYAQDLENDFKKYNNKLLQFDEYDFNSCFAYVDKDSLKFSILNPEDYMINDLLDCHKKVLFMSATSDKKFIKSYIPEDKIKFIDVKSPFSANNRRVHYIKSGKFGYGLEHRSEDVKILMDLINRKCNDHIDERGVIHTISIAIMNLIKNNIHRLDNSDRFIFTTSPFGTNPIDKAFETLKNSKNGILVGANFREGKSFDDDLARFQILVKLPYPTKDTPYNEYKINNDDNWQNSKCIVGLNQIYGRIVRNVDDYGVTYILGDTPSKSINYYLLKTDRVGLSYFMEGVRGKIGEINTLCREDHKETLFKHLGAQVNKDGSIAEIKRQVMGNMDVAKRAINGGNKIHYMSVHSFLNDYNLINKIPIDLDFPADIPDNERESLTLDFIDYLKKFFNINTIYSHSSGGKGFHIFIPINEPFVIDNIFRSDFSGVMSGLVNKWVEDNPHLGDNIIDPKIPIDIKRIIKIPFITRFDNNKIVGARIYNGSEFVNLDSFIVDKMDYINEVFNPTIFNEDFNFDIKQEIINYINDRKSKEDSPVYDIDKHFRADRPEITDLLNLVFASDGKSCICPFHDDHNPSAFVLVEDDFKYGLHCQTCQKTWYTFYDYNNSEWIVKEKS